MEGRIDFIEELLLQAEEADTRSYGGPGLGLTISQNLVRMLNGEIKVESKLGEGSIFYFTLPLPIREISQPELIPKDNLQDLESAWKDKVFMVAEDDKYNFSIIEELLRGTGATIIHAWNGKEVLEQVKSDIKFDMILMDIRMPVINGLIAAQEIRKTNPDIIIIAQTAHANEEDKRLCLEAGCHDYVSKPIDKKQLLITIQKYINS